MRNTPAVFALLVALLALGVIAGAIYVTREQVVDVSWLQAALAAPLAALLGILALSFAGMGRARYQRTLGRAGGRALIRLARSLGFLALLLSVTAGLAVAVFGVLVWTDGLTEAPW